MRLRLAIAVMLGAAAVLSSHAQTHATKKPESVVRAVAVYEWTGDADKPTASRVVPVSLFINGQFEDAGVYLPRPVPFVLYSGNIFEIEKSGQPEGTLELAFQQHTQPGGMTTYDDGWSAYGKFKPAVQPVLVAKKSGPLSPVVTSGGSGPKFANKSADKSASQPVDRSTAAGNGTTVSADKADEPTLHKKTDGSDTETKADAKTTATGGVPDTSNDPDDPADRPTLKRRTPQERKDEAKKKATASVTGGGDLNDDPDRPNLHRGVAKAEVDIPALKGVPASMQQMVGVSDARNRPEHDFSRVWESDDEKADVTANLQAMARAKLAEYGDLPTPPAVAAAPVAASTKVPQTAAARARAKKAAAAVPPPPAPPVALNDESVRAYTLSYQGAATFVYTASSPGAAATTRYVTVVAQRDPLGKLQVAMASATDSTHLDRTAWMRLVDAVDADASNRASLLFELRAQSSRQFALYRVIGAKSEQLFATTSPQ